jgi:RNA polymerase sigma factor (sigma-70 family)
VNKTNTATYELTHLDRNGLISELYNRYGRKLYAYGIRTWHLNEDESWELIYKTLYKVIEVYKKYNFESEEKFASFVFRIFINLLRNHYRDHQKNAVTFNSIEDFYHLPEQAVQGEIQNIKMHILQEELDSMEDWQRILLLMRSDGVSYSEIAGYVDKPEEQLKVYYQRLKKLITEKINGKLR